MSVPRKIVYNVFASSLSKILSTVGALISIGLITRYLGKNDFGLYVIALAFFQLFNSVGDWGLYQTMTREISTPDTNEEEIVSNVSGLRIIVSSFIILLSPIAIWFLPYSPQLKIAIFLVCLAFFFSSLSQLLVGLYQKRLKMDQVAFAELAGKAVQVFLIFLGIKFDLGFNFIVGTLLITMALNFLIIFLISRKFIKFKPKFNPSYWKPFLKQAFPIGLSVIVTFIYFKADSIILSFFRDPNEVGIYGAAYKIIENLSFFPSMIVGLTMPIFAYNVFTNREKFELIVNKNFKVFVILVLPLLIGTVFLAEGIIDLIAGPDFAQSALVLRILIFSIAFIFFGNLFNNILIVAKLQKQLFWALLVAAVINVSLNLLFIPKFSYLATSYVSVLTEGLVVVFGAFITFKHLRFVPKTDSFGSILFSAFLMGCFLWFFSWLPFFVKVLGSPLVYFGALALTGGVEKEEILMLIKKDKASRQQEI